MGLQEQDFFQRTTYRFRCSSYYFCAEGAPGFGAYFKHSLDYFMKHKLRVFMDSGAHSFQEKTYLKTNRSVRKLKKAKSNVGLMDKRQSYLDAVEEYFKGYIEWIKGCGINFDFYVTFDYQTIAPTVWEMTKRMYDAGTQPIPVYHGDQGLDWMQRYVDLGHKLIGIGWNPLVDHHPQRLKYYAQVHNFAAKRGLYLHGFACTGSLAFVFPWYSVDSTTWLRTAAAGGIIIPEERGNQGVRLKVLRISDRTMAKELRSKDLRDLVEKAGFELDNLAVDRSSRALFNALTFKQLSMRNNHRPTRGTFF